MSRSSRSRGTRAQKRKCRSRKSPPTTHGESLVALQEQFLPDDSIFASVKFHGNTSWSPRALVWQALFWSWSECRNVTDAFTDASACCQRISGTKPLTTYQGFMGALTRWTATFMPLLWMLLQARMEEWGGEFWRIDGWVPIAFDGSRSTAPRTKANEKAFCAAHYGKGQTARYRKKKSKGMRRKKNERNRAQPQEPQAWITLMWHMGLRLPWSWRLGPSNSSERAHVVEMVGAGKFPKDTLFCGDAGFVGYPLWSEILRNGAHFLVRVGANVNLLTESADFQRQQNGLVLCWPKAMMKAGQPPLRLRLVRVRIGKTKVWMLTSVLDAARLSDRQMVKLYKMRWGIEIEFRGLKQTLDCGKLCCRNDQRLLAELHWSIMAMAVAELLALKEQLSTRQRKSESDKYTPVKRSLAQTIRTLRHCLSNIDEIPPPNDDLRTKLRAAVTDSYERTTSKRGRYRPPNPDKKPLGDPKIRRLTRDEKQNLKVTQKTAA
jgi:DDE family transposase